MLLTGSTDPNYYYVPLLVQLYLVAPFIVLLARWRWPVLLGVTAVLQVGVYVLQYAIVLDARDPMIRTVAAALPKWFFLAHLFWFSAGVVVGFQHQAFKAVLERVQWLLLPALTVLFLAGVVEWELLLRWSGSPWRENRATLLDGMYAATMILSFLSIRDLRLPFPDKLIALGTQSFGIYLVHGIVMEFFSRGLYHFAPWILGQQWLFQPLLIALGLSVPLVLMWAVRRSPSRGLYAYVFG
jgi:peptidoglycan/LPS O-acetylase OafA/YrhL